MTVPRCGLGEPVAETDFRDDAGLKAEAEAAAHEGFTGKLAIHPAQVEIINAAFTPSKEDIHLTRQLVEGARLLGLKVHDHVVIGHGRHVSLAQRGLI